MSSFFSGILISLGIVCVDVACCLGNPGICNAIMNTSSIILTLINFIFFNQDFIFMQGLGVFICTIGAVLISTAE